MRSSVPSRPSDGGRSVAAARRLAREVVLAPLHAYRIMLAPLLPPSCRFEPSCSAYALDSVRRHGIARGGWLAARRVLRCNPRCEGGSDPVPEVLS